MDVHICAFTEKWNWQKCCQKNMFDNVKICPTSGTCCLSSSIFANKLTISSVDTHFKSPNFSEMITLFCCAPALPLSTMPPARRSKHATGLTHFPFIHLSTLKGNWQMIIAKIACPPKLRNVMQKAPHFQMIWPEIGFFFYFLTNFKTTGRGIFLSS